MKTAKVVHDIDETFGFQKYDGVMHFEKLRKERAFFLFFKNMMG